MKRLGVNIDHIATIRNARNEVHPDPLVTAKQAFKFGADSITIHLREDRRHIKDIDVKKLTKTQIPINLEIAANNEMLEIALRYKPNFVCLVPENRKEITTEGGINILKNYNIIKRIIAKLNDKKIRTSLFINPNYKDIKLSHIIGSKCIELHTGRISERIKFKKKYSFELQKIKKCANYAKSLGLEVHAGHGMDYKTVSILSNIKHIEEFNVGHFIIGESVINGIGKVIKKFKRISKK